MWHFSSQIKHTSQLMILNHTVCLNFRSASYAPVYLFSTCSLSDGNSHSCSTSKSARQKPAIRLIISRQSLPLARFRTERMAERSEQIPAWKAPSNGWKIEACKAQRSISTRTAPRAVLCIPEPTKQPIEETSTCLNYLACSRACLVPSTLIYLRIASCRWSTTLNMSKFTAWRIFYIATK